MIGLIFIVGCLISSLYVTFFLFENRVDEKNENNIEIDDTMDYDGHGNWGRFPPKKIKIKEGGVKKNK